MEQWRPRGARLGRHLGTLVLSILDTSILIAERPSPIEGTIGISVASIAELQFGVLVATDDESRARRLARLSATLRAFDPLPVDSLVAACYGQLAAATARTGRRAGASSLSLMIAATAHAHGARLITTNASDILHLEDLVEIVVV